MFKKQLLSRLDVKLTGEQVMIKTFLLYYKKSPSQVKSSVQFKIYRGLLEILIKGSIAPRPPLLCYRGRQVLRGFIPVTKKTRTYTSHHMLQWFYAQHQKYVPEFKQGGESLLSCSKHSSASDSLH